MAQWMTKKEMACFGDDHKLLIIKQWKYKGRSYSARRDTDGYIGIVSDKLYYGVGNAGFDHCLLESGIDALARKLNVMA